MPARPAGPIVVQRRVSKRGSIMVAIRRIHVGMIYEGKIVTVTAGDHSFEPDMDGERTGLVARTSGWEIHRYKPYVLTDDLRASADAIHAAVDGRRGPA